MKEETRIYSTSIRYSDSVSRIVNSVKGKTFADRFEYICLNYEKEKKKREDELKLLDKRIADSKRTLTKVTLKIEKSQGLFDDLQKIKHYVDNVLKGNFEGEKNIKIK